MPKARHDESITTTGGSDVLLLSWLATCVSVISFLFYFKLGEVLLYGDAIAHTNIARRVFDSKTPGLLQLGTVWLPLPHLLMIPFLVSNELWRRGAGGSIPSMVAYVFAVAGVFRLTRGTLSPSTKPDGVARIAAWAAAVIFATNPNLIYMQTTAMGEVLYLAFFVWSVVYFSEAARGEANALLKCGLCLAAACLTRYDGWFLAATMAGIVLWQAIFRWRSPTEEKSLAPSPALAIKFTLIAAASPILWLAYNGIVYRNPLEFENGPYSAKAIEQHTQDAGHPGHPGSGNLLLAGRYLLKAGEDNVAANEWLQRAWVLIGAAVVIAGLLTFRGPTAETASRAPRTWLPLFFLLIPLPFYALSIAYGGVPIFIPNWWPFSHYNVRYGLQLLPAFAVSLAIPVYISLSTTFWNRRLRLACVVASFAFAAASYATVWRATPLCLEEAQINMRMRTQLDIELSRWLERLPPNATLLMYVGDHPGAVERAGIPFSHTINEGNHRVWKQPIDLDGLWERALADPRKYADYALAFEGDPVWQSVHNLHLPELVEIHVTGQARAVLYQTR